jgi:hypothetical protein
MGPTWGIAKDVIVTVLPPGPGLPSTARLQLIPKRSGRGLHTLLGCPRCGGARAVLYAEGTGQLGCGRCVRHRTRHQRSARSTDYLCHGGRQLDLIMRLASRELASTGALDRLNNIADELRHFSAALVESALDAAGAALSATERT